MQNLDYQQSSFFEYFIGALAVNVQNPDKVFRFWTTKKYPDFRYILDTNLDHFMKKIKLKININSLG